MALHTEYANDAIIHKSGAKNIMVKTLVRIAVICFFAITVQGDDSPLSPKLPNGQTLEPAGRTFDVGNMPLSAAVSPDGKLVLLLSGYREQGVQVVDPESGRVIQTLPQPAAFIGLAFNHAGDKLYASGASENVIYEYAWNRGTAAFKRKLALSSNSDLKEKSRTPAGIALSRDNRYLFVAENLSDTFAVVDIASGAIVDRRSAGHFPYAVGVSRRGEVFVSAWGGSIITRFRIDSKTGKIRNATELTVGRHPSALLLNSAGSRLFVACGSIDAIAVVDARKFRVIETLKDSVPGVSEGSTPNALALSTDQTKLYVAEADNNAVAVFQLSSSSSGSKSAAKKDQMLGRIPVGWYPTAFAQIDNRIFVVNGKGRGTRANPGADQDNIFAKTPNEYVLGQLNGTVTELPHNIDQEKWADYSRTISKLNNWDRSTAKPAYPPFKHVMYIIKENRTYDQVFGDMLQGDGDPSLLFFPRSASPNHRALAERFGLFDRFFVNAEVSVQGHKWSTAAYVTDFTEKTVHSVYSERRPGEAYEDDVSEAAAGYIWNLAMRSNRSLRIYGEYAALSPDKKTYISNVRAAKPYTSPTYPGWDLNIKDQARADAWLAEFKEFANKGNMPALQVLWLPQDHTAGARAGLPTPAACFADNDLALGRIIEALSNSPFWKDTAVFVLEDDAQDGADHVDSHRSVMLAISAYSKPQVWHRFVNTTDVLATLEQILGLGALSQFDYYGRPLLEVFSETPDLTPYKAIIPAQSLDEKNPDGKSAQASLALELDKEDRSDDALFNRILWAVIKGDSPPFPGPQHVSLQQLQQEQ
jgi:DNA-binding beta-propeller fold protein YncE